MNDKSFPIEVDEMTKIGDMKALIEVETGISIADQEVIFNNTLVSNDEAFLKNINVKDGDMLLVQRKLLS